MLYAVWVPTGPIDATLPKIKDVINEETQMGKMKFFFANTELIHVLYTLASLEL